MEAEKKCWCCGVLGLLVIAFAWCPAGWAKIALTILGLLVIVCNVTPFCGKFCRKKKEEPPPTQP